MATKGLRPARDVAQERGTRGFRIDHAIIVDSDYEWLGATQRLTLWNVRMPDGFLSRLEHLIWLDIRGGSGADLDMVRGSKGLRYLAVNQVRGMRDLCALTELHDLQALMLFGLPQVMAFPSLGGLVKLERADVGSMKGLTSLSGLLDAPHLQELLLLKTIGFHPTDVDRIAGHHSLRAFDWFAEDVPCRVWAPVVERIKLPKVAILSAGDWFRKHLGEPPASITGEEARELARELQAIMARPATDSEKLEAARQFAEARKLQRKAKANPL